MSRFTNDQLLTPPPETLVTMGGVELFVSTVSNIRSPVAWGETDRVVPVPLARLPTAEIDTEPPLLPDEATVRPQAS